MTAQLLKKENLWEPCEVCGVQLLVLDSQLHLKTCCPPSQQNWTHDFIFKSVLYGHLSDLGACDDKFEKQVHRVYLSAEVLKKFVICIGDPVVVSGSNVSCVKRAWISPEGHNNITAISMPKRVLELMWETTKGNATVEKLFKSPKPAAKIVVSPKSGSEIVSDWSNLAANLNRLFLGQIILRNQKILLPYLGKDLFLVITEVTAVPTDINNLADKRTEDLKTVSLNSPEKSEFYGVVSNTKWVMSTPKENNRNLLATVGGLNNVILQLKKVISNSLYMNTKNFPKLHGIILYGPSGTGKTLLARALTQETTADFYELKYDELYSKILGETETRLKTLFSQIKSSNNAIVLFDRIDSLCPKRSLTLEATDLERRILYLVISSLDDLTQSGCDVFVLATAYDPDNIAPSLRRLGRFELEIEIPVPCLEARFDILSKLLHGLSHKLSKEDIRLISQAAHGFVGADLASLVSTARAVMIEIGQQDLTLHHLQLARKKVHPSTMKEILVNIPNVRWSDIGGQEDLKLKLRQIVEWPLTHPECFARLGIRQPRGILMFGPPGCSKTMIARALASESKLNFLSIKGPELFNKWLGESERAVRAVFRRARQVAPAIIFFDEIDALGGERSQDSGSSSNVEDRVLSQLLVEMNGVELLENVFVVAATNRPDLIDKALLRPGRLDHKVYVPLPDAETRKSILRIQMKKMPIEKINVEELVEATDGFSGAEVVALCHEAALIAMSANINCTVVKKEHFNSALTVVTPRTCPALLQTLKNFIK